MNYINGNKIIISMDSDDYTVLGVIARMDGFKKPADLLRDYIAKQINSRKGEALEYLRAGKKPAATKEPEQIVDLPAGEMNQFLNG